MKPRPTRRLSERERVAFLRRYDPDGVRLPLLHERGARVVLSRGAFHARATLLDTDGSPIVAYSWTLGALREQVTATFEPDASA